MLKRYELKDEDGGWTVYDVWTGQPVVIARRSQTSLPLVHAAGRVYALTMNGNTIVFEPNPSELKVLAENPLGETTRASLAFSNRQVFVRTYQNLYCVEEIPNNK